MLNSQEIQIPFKKSAKNSKNKKQILKNGVKILVKSYFTRVKKRKNFNFTEEEEKEFLKSFENNKGVD